MAADRSQQVGIEVTQWLEELVIGLQLCPFAAKPVREKQHRIVVSPALDIQAALIALQDEIDLLDQNIKPEARVETTLIVLPEMFGDFYDFNDFLSLTDGLLASGGWQGKYQIASFHPRYQFAGSQVGDVENLTNCAPYPILHILREASLSAAIDSYSDVEKIPERNIRRMQKLTAAERKRYFPYL